MSPIIDVAALKAELVKRIDALEKRAGPDVMKADVDKAIEDRAKVTLEAAKLLVEGAKKANTDAIDALKADPAMRGPAGPPIKIVEVTDGKWPTSPDTGTLYIDARDGKLWIWEA